MIVRRRIARPRLKVLLSKMRSALSSWYNHDRHTFLIRHGGSKQTLSKGNGPNPISIKQLSDMWRAEKNEKNEKKSSKENKKDEQTHPQENALKKTTDTDAGCRLTIGRAKQQLRTMVPFTTKEMHAYVSLLGVEQITLDDEITLHQFDHLLNLIESDMVSKYKSERERASRIWKAL